MPATHSPRSEIVSDASGGSDASAMQVCDLSVGFGLERGTLAAVNGVSFDLAPGEALAVVGESGSGKSVMLRALMGLLPARTASIGGRIRLRGDVAFRAASEGFADVRGKRIAMIFQEPLLALDPVFTVGDQLIEAIVRHKRIERRAARRHAARLLEQVGIPLPERRLKAYPHELSGGLRQRAMIAIALSCGPDVLLADEPTTALDVSVQMQIILLLRELQRESDMSIVFVTHDIAVAAQIGARIAVMYAGKFVELGPARNVLRTPCHPYTVALMRSVPRGKQRNTPLETIIGAPPDLANLPAGCSFASRCSFAESDCLAAAPPAIVDGEHMFRCIHPVVPTPVRQAS